MTTTTNRARPLGGRWPGARPVAVVCAAAFMAVGCIGGRGNVGAADGRLDVFAAASLTEPFTELAERYEAEHPDVEVVLNLGGSSALREQILEGAPADVFASASEPIMDELVAADAVAGSPIPFASNRLALAVPAGNPGAVTGIEDLARADLLVGLCGAEVPCGALARLSLERAGVRAEVDTNEPDVRSLLTKIAIGELDVGLVYTSDIGDSDTRATDSDGVEVEVDVEGIAIPDEFQAPTVYPIAATAPTEVDSDVGGSTEADRFIDFVTSEQGRTILADHGFGPP